MFLKDKRSLPETFMAELTNSWISASTPASPLGVKHPFGCSSLFLSLQGNTAMCCSFLDCGAGQESSHQMNNLEQEHRKLVYLCRKTNKKRNPKSLCLRLDSPDFAQEKRLSTTLTREPMNVRARVNTVQQHRKESMFSGLLPLFLWHLACLFLPCCSKTLLKSKSKGEKPQEKQHARTVQ